MQTENTNTVSVNVANASKKDASVLADVVMDHRNEKRAASRIVSDLNQRIGSVLIGGAASDKDLEKIVSEAKESFDSAMKSVLSRAISLRGLSRGTTGPGGIHRDDAVAELFASSKKSDAVSRNTDALKRAGRIS
jgi:ribosomal protein RSM22 (predicted rRNA methylase)